MHNDILASKSRLASLGIAGSWPDAKGLFWAQRYLRRQRCRLPQDEDEAFRMTPGERDAVGSVCRICSGNVKAARAHGAARFSVIWPQQSQSRALSGRQLGRSAPGIRPAHVAYTLRVNGGK